MLTEKLKLSPEAAKYISLQRLETQALGGKIHYTKLGRIAYKIYEHIPLSKKIFRFYSTSIEPRLRSDKVIAEYSDVMRNEFFTIADHVGENLQTVIGVGPGMAGLEVFLSRYCQEETHSAPLIFLIDKTGIDPIKYGFHEVAAAYNSLEMSRNSLIVNGHPEDKVVAVDADEAEQLLYEHSGKVDLVTSLIAWGFHFPVETYLELMLKLLKPEGRLIMDVRKESGGRETLEKAFESVSVIYDDPKFERVLATGRHGSHGRV